MEFSFSATPAGVALWDAGRAATAKVRRAESLPNWEWSEAKARRIAVDAADADVSKARAAYAAAETAYYAVYDAWSHARRAAPSPVDLPY